ncbi:unnamed protein product [Malus baccata var. baccata]
MYNGDRQVINMASSSAAAAAAPISPRRKHDVFLSFRGEDTRDTFTSHLHAALLRKKLDIYIDYKLERGNEIGPALVEAIGKSKLSVIIFSKNYASSSWCLDELLHILGCKEGDGQFVIPIFYDISPADVRKQQGSYAVAFAQLEERFKDCMDKVLEWRDALEKVANLSGFDNSNKAGELQRLQLSGSSFQEMYNLRLLKIYGSEDFPKFIGFHDAIFGEVYYKIDLSQGLESLPNALKYLYWDRYPLKSLPSKFSPNNLVELRMPYSRLEAPLWNKNQNLGNLKVIDLSYCTHLAEVPDLSRSSKIEHINLSGCIRLERIPSYFKGFDKLTYLHLGHCENLKFFPQMPDNIEFLDLSFTAIEELPASSIQCLLGLTTLKLSYCSRLVSLPESICKLKSLERLDLTDCLEFKYFPEILEPMEHLKFLSLKGTEVEELHSSIGMLIGLQSLILDRCENLQLVPDSINSLKHLKTLSFIGCLSLKNLNLSLSLCSLEVIRLCFCEIPNHLVFLPWLRDLDLGGTNIESLPSSVIQASQLSHLRLNNCTSLRSLPELPVLRYLEANGCESLQTVSRSRTSLTQAWDKYDLFRGSYHFAKCPKLDDKALSNIVSDAHLRIMQVATAPSNFKEVERYKVSLSLSHAHTLSISLLPFYSRGISGGTSVSIVYEGNELPNWFSHQNWCGTNFLGLALSLVVDQNFGVANVKFGCKCNFRTDNGESREISYPYYVPFNERGYDISRSSHVFVWYSAFAIEEIENFRCSNSFYKLVTKASFDFHFLDHRDRSHKTNFQMCGICLLYAQDADGLISDAQDADGYLCWDRYPLKSLPSKFSPNSLVELRMPYSRLEAPLWNTKPVNKFLFNLLQNLGNLKVIDISYCTHLAEVPDLSRTSKIEHINFSGCIRLTRIPSYFKDFDKLTYLHLGHSENLKSFPQMPDNIEFLDLSFTTIKELPTSAIQCLRCFLYEWNIRVSFWLKSKCIKVWMKGCMCIKGLSFFPFCNNEEPYWRVNQSTAMPLDKGFRSSYQFVWWCNNGHLWCIISKAELYKGKCLTSNCALETNERIKMKIQFFF